MELEHKPLIHDTIDLEEIRSLLGDSPALPEEPDSAPQELDPPAQAAAEPAPETEPEGEEDQLQLPDFPQEEKPAGEEPEPQMEPESTEPVPAPEEPQMEPDTEEAEPEKKKPNAALELYNMLHDVVYLLAAVTLIFVFVVRLVGVNGDSMLPTLENGDLLILESNFLYSGDDLKYGDIVVLNVPTYESSGDGPIVKRIIATEGQEVNIDFETGAVYVDGVLLDEPYINSSTNYNWDGEYGLEYPAVVPENCVFVLGDNRNNSMDSRYAPIGMVDERCVLGKVLFIAFPGQTTDGMGNVIYARDFGRIGLVS